MRLRPFVIGISALGLVAVSSAFLHQERSASDGARLFTQVLQRIADNAVDSLSRAAIFERAARGLVQQLDDPYADLYSPEQLASFQRNTLKNNYAGIGVSIEDQNGIIVVARVIPNSPAEHAGLQSGDRMLRVDSTQVTGLKLDQVSSKLLGAPGTKVEVVLLRTGVPEPIRSTFTRSLIKISAVPFTTIVDKDVGYIPLQSFNESAARDVETAMLALRNHGARAFVLDLRGNGGGSVEQSLEITNLFFHQGQELATVRHRGKIPEVYRATRTSIVDSMPLIVLVDGSSASAAEIVAGSLQDHDRALVVGTTSFGKGLVQTMFPLQDGWAMKITTGKWYTPSGRSIQADHDRLGDERFVEYATADSTEHQRPTFKSDGGRVILGGGGVTPDVTVKPDTLSGAELELARAYGASSMAWYTAVYRTSLDHKTTVKPDFKVDPAWRETLWTRLKDAKVPVSRAQFDAGARLVDRSLEHWTAKLSYGDSLAFRRSIPYDRQITTALEYLRRGPTQRALLGLAEGASTKSNN